MQFGSDNHTGASSQVLEMMVSANTGYTAGYGNDDWTMQAVVALRKVFECDLEAFFVPTGTASNSLALSCMVQPWETIICHEHAHIYLDESTAPEFFTGGARLKAIAKGVGKISADLLNDYYINSAGVDFPHNSRVGALSITQASELGQVYTPEEIKSLSEIAKEHNINFHMDGARFANAVAHLNCTPAELTWKSGVDVLCLGATKCGALCAEAVIFFNKELSENFIHRRKRTGHLISKGRIFGSQFVGWLKNDHWLDLATHANAHAQKLAADLSSVEEIQLAWPVEANEIFVIISKKLFKVLKEAGGEFYEWYDEALPLGRTLKEDQMLIRLVTSFATEDQHRIDFINVINQFYSVQ
ncbi:MAG: threonine aldolase [Planctomycetota bacterium]|nr:MAG: threonine aldolase [Planctomycetota bacterium]